MPTNIMPTNNEKVLYKPCFGQYVRAKAFSSSGPHPKVSQALISKVMTNVTSVNISCTPNKPKRVSRSRISKIMTPL